MQPERLMTESLRTIPSGAAISRVMAAALAAAEPAAAIHRFFQRQGTTLTVAGTDYALDQIERVFVVGAGKAATPMAFAVADVLGERLSGGVVVVKDGHLDAERAPGPLAFYEASHPVPDARGIAAAEQIASLLENTSERDLVIAVISGGGSALLTRPVAGVSLAELQALTRTLLASGASIDEINTLRKHLDSIKGGGLARLAAPARLATLILSDVVGSPLDVIASGPTVADPSSYTDALGILERYDILAAVPASILAHLQAGARGEAEETLKPGDPQLERVQNVIVGSNPQAAQAALEQARNEGFHALLLTTYLQGEAREAGRFLAAIARELVLGSGPLPLPACLVLGGETTVTLRGQGLGGRNQEMALAAVAEFAGLAGATLATLATDGGDGPTDAAGAIVCGDTLARAAERGMVPATFLADNNAYHFFAPLGDLLRPGPTHTNVNDLAFLFVGTPA